MADFIGYIRSAALARGIDPDIAVRVAQSEGGTSSFIQSGYSRNGIREPSYGPFQLLVGGTGTGYGAGLGNAFEAQTGLSASDPNNVYQTIDFALDNAATSGWSAWYGAAKAGISKWTGIGSDAKAVGVSDKAPNSSGSPDDRDSSNPENLGKTLSDLTTGFGDAAPSSGGASSEGGSWLGINVEAYFSRFIIIVLGFIFVAVGLALFKPELLPAPVKAAIK